MEREEVRGDGDLDAVLHRASRATAGLEPESAIVDAVMRSVATEPRRTRPGIAEDVARSGPWAVALAGVAAAAIALLSVQAEQQVAGDLVATLDAAEIAP